MGIRMTQTIGLHSNAEEWLNENCMKVEKIEKCPQCQFVLSTIRYNKCEVYDKSGRLGMFEDGPALHEYTLQDGSKVREVEQ